MVKEVDPRIATFLKEKQRVESSNTCNNNSNKQNEKQHLVVVADAETLLARLNTKILYRRLRHFAEKNGTSPCNNSCYSKNKPTAELASEEWNALVERAKNKTTSTENSLPSRHELLLFSPCPRPVTVLASYPRSGNSLLRNLYERVTLRVTGSDMRGGLTQHDLVGEAAVSARLVQFVKTHYPERIGKPAFLASRAVLLTRNPYDALDSYFNLMMTNTHTTSLTESQQQVATKRFEEMVIKEVQVWRLFHQFWLRKSNIPILLVRYEDLIRYPDKVLARVIQFVLEVNNMTFFQHRIQQCQIVQDDPTTSTGTVAVGAYKPRSGGIGKSLSKYSPTLLQTINPILSELMHQLGYGELLVPKQRKEEWKLDPIPRFGFELNNNKKKKKNNANTILEINQGPIVRDPKLRTDWKALRREIGIMDNGEGGATSSKDNIANAYLDN